jgi:hypothetical protein
MKKLIPILMLCVLFLTACSSSQNNITSDVTVKWDNGVIYINGKATPITDYKGYEASVSNGSGGLSYIFTLDNAIDATNLAVNMQGIEEVNMTSFKGKLYYTEYLGSMFTMAQKLSGDDWIVCQANTNGLPDTTVANYASNYIDDMKLTNGQVYVDFGDFTFGDSYDAVEVRSDCALIYGVAKVSLGTFNTTSTVSIIQGEKEYQLQKGSSSKYDYYVYGDYVIQLASGLDVGTYITFK